MYRRLLADAHQRLSPAGAVLIQLRREVLEADRNELPELRSRLDDFALLAA
jgi:hypothetical protein